MACLQTHFRSAVLGMDTRMNITLPYDRYDEKGNPGRCDKVLYLLHGLKQNADSWVCNSGIERYAKHHGFAVIMPEVQRSFYADMEMGMKYFTYITEELPRVVHGMLKLPKGRENTYVGGLSMGGYGALKCALARPDLYAGAMCFSSGFYAMEDTQMLMDRYFTRGELQGVMGLDMKIKEENDLDHLMRHFPKDAQKPKLYLACGTEDFLYRHNTRARDTLRENGFELTWEEWSGVHDWDFWDKAASRAITLFDETK